MKRLYLILSIIVAFFLVWFLCGNFLGFVITDIIKLESHDDFADYWFALFVAAEAIVITSIIFVYVIMTKNKKTGAHS